MELCAILDLLRNHRIYGTVTLQFSYASPAVFRWASHVAELLDHPTVIRISSRDSNRSNDHAASHREESVPGKRAGKHRSLLTFGSSFHFNEQRLILFLFLTLRLLFSYSGVTAVNFYLPLSRLCYLRVFYSLTCVR